MRITRNIFVTLLLFYVVFGGIAIGVLLLLILPQFVALERQNARLEIEGAVQALDREVESLSTILGTWRYWNDMHQFAQDQNVAFMDGNLSLGDVQSAECQLISILDKDHKLIFSITDDLSEAEKESLKRAEAALIELSRALSHERIPGAEISGFLRVGDQPMLVAAGMITDGAGEAEPSGVLIMIRFLTTQRIESIGKQLGIPLVVKRADEDLSSGGVQSEDKLRIVELDRHKILAAAVIEGLDGRAAINVSAVTPRRIRTGAMNTIKTVSVIYLFGGIIAAIIFFMALDSIVLRRLLRLNTEINRISFSGRTSSTVSAEGSDEIARTASTINQMIARLDAAHALVKKNEAQFRMVTELAPVGIFMTDMDGKCTFVNHHYVDITGRSAASALGDGWMDAIYPEDRGRFVTGREASLESLEPYTLEVRFLRPDGTVRWVRSAAKPVYDDDGNIIGRLGTLTDITSSKLKQMELEHKALYDPLTALANRVLFHDRLSHAFEAARRRPPHHFAVFYMDLDGFKAVNDTHGHEAGDVVLREIAVRMSRLLRPGDTLSRVGGDEFAIILRDTVEVRHCHAVADRVLEAVRKPISLGDVKVEVGISIGAAIDHKGYESPNDLVNAADKAMYRAKLGGKNRVVFANPPTTAASPSSTT